MLKTTHPQQEEAVSKLSYALPDYQHLSIEQHHATQSLWVYMRGTPRPCFSWPLIHDLHGLIQSVGQFPHNYQGSIEYIVGASQANGIFSLGGDLEQFIKYIRQKDSEQLRAYAYAAVEIGFNCYQQFHRGITTIALVEGTCYGGGFEAALSCNVLIAEESAQFSFPEISFNLFPGMGAYSFLTRRVAPNVAEKIITSGRVYTGQELYALGVIDVCVATGEGHKATLDYISQHRRQRLGRNAMHRARQAVQPITMEELKQVCDIWVEAALKLDEKALRVMERFARAQANRSYTKRETGLISQVA